MPSPRLSLLVGLVFLLASLAAGCGPKPSVIASFHDLEGSQSSLGIPASRGAAIAAEDLAGPGVPLKVESYDSRSDPRVSRPLAAQAALSATVGAGFTDSDVALGGAQEFARRQKVFMIAGATDPSLPERCGPGTYLVPFGDDAQAVAAADLVRKRFGTKVIVVADMRSDYTRVLAGYFENALRVNGGTVVARLDPTKTGFAESFAEAAAKLPPDAVFLSLQPDLLTDVVGAVRRALPEAPLVGGDAFDVAGVEEIDPSAKGEGALYFTTHAWFGEGAPRIALDFAHRYRTRHGEDPTAFAALGYDATMLAAWVARLRSGGGGLPTPSEVDKALRARTPGYMGVTGEIAYGDGPVPDKDVWIIKVKDRRTSLADRARPDRSKAR